MGELLRALREVRLETVVVGATAAALLGAPILTADIDLLVRDTPRNREKIRALAKALRASVQPISPLEDTLRLHGTPVPIDFLFDELSAGLGFQRLRARAQRVRIGDEEAVVACLEDVLASKVAADRPKDRAQLPVLRDAIRVQEAARRPKAERSPRKRPRPGR